MHCPSNSLTCDELLFDIIYPRHPLLHILYLSEFTAFGINTQTTKTNMKDGKFGKFEEKRNFKRLCEF